MLLGAVASGAWAAAAGCGARSELYLPLAADAGAEDDRPQPTGAFCAEETYDSGPTDLSMYVVLDRSGSMTNDNRWAAVAAALSAFVDDPGSAGLGIGLMYYPVPGKSDSCSVDDYALPAVPIGKLPGNAAAIKASLAKINPNGETPTLPALRGGIQYARSVVLANPKERVVLALVTDGDPNTCGSTAQKVAEFEQQAVTTDPKVLTYVIGLATGFTDAIGTMAAAGGTGKPILVDDGAASAQKIVDAMQSVKAAQAKCIFGVPIPAGAQPKAQDLSVRYRTAPGADPKELAIVADFASCSGEAFYPDDVDSPGSITLCPAACDAVHAAPKSQVTVTSGCGLGNDGGLPDAHPDAPGCLPNVDFSCIPACGSSEQQAPACVDDAWTCPPGTFPSTKCETCPDVPHGCCHGDGTFVIASCLNGAWTCPPGDTLFGSPGCSPPQVCTLSLPCAFGTYCDEPDDSCGKSSLLGTCKSAPSCSETEPPVCGCDGTVYANVCSGAAAGVDVSGNSDCSTPSGTFPCGGYFCTVGAQVCRKTTHLGAVVPDSYKCVPIPAGCGNGCGCKLCDQCPPNGPCGTCGPDGPEGGVYLQCTVVGP